LEWIMSSLPFSTMFRSGRRLLLAFLLLATLAAGAAAQTLVSRVVDTSAAIAHLAIDIEAGQVQTADRLRRLGFEAQVDEALTLDNGLRYHFSSRTLIETLHQRAELADPGVGGDRFLRVLYDDAASQSAQLATDPEFRWLRDRFPADEVDLSRRPLRFASMAELAAAPSLPLSDNVSRAVAKIADSFAEPHTSRIRHAMIQRLNLGNHALRSFEQAIASSSSRTDAIRNVLAQHLPPPQVQAALRRVLGDLRGFSAAHSLDDSLASIMDALSHESELPEELRTYAEVEDSLPSRTRQMALADEAGLPGRLIANEGNSGAWLADATIGVTDAAVLPDAPAGGTSAGRGWMATAKPLKPSITASSTAHVASYRTYAANAFSGVDRTYRTAIRLPSLARGIAVGGPLEVETRMRAAQAVWVPNDADDRFGRLFLVLSPPEPSWWDRVLTFLGLVEAASAEVAASEVMFTDSFMSAAALLAYDQDSEFRYREGELLILMSMDPEGEVGGAEIEKLRGRRAKLLANYQALDQAWSLQVAAVEAQVASRQAAAQALEVLYAQSYARRFQALETALRKLGARIPRRVVLHPSIQGRELGWSTVRVDFWFNKLDQLSAEAAEVGGSGGIPVSLLAADFAGANTWQFYERPRILRLAASGADHSLLTVVPDNSEAADATIGQGGSQFAVSMFAYADRPPAGGVTVDGEDGVFRLPKIEAELQPMLDWLATRHHDFIRLNHFSQALSILRWLARSDTEVAILDPDGDAVPIATPDRVYISEGPAPPPPQ
jgi:hypothetical protein